MAQRKQKVAPDEAVRIASNVDVKKFSDRILKLHSEMDDLRADIKGEYDAASNAGIDRKALKLAIKEKKKPVPVEEKRLANSYLEKLGQLALFADFE